MCLFAVRKSTFLVPIVSYFSSFVPCTGPVQCDFTVSANLQASTSFWDTHFRQGQNLSIIWGEIFILFFS